MIRLRPQHKRYLRKMFNAPLRRNCVPEPGYLRGLIAMGFVRYCGNECVRRSSQRIYRLTANGWDVARDLFCPVK